MESWEGSMGESGKRAIDGGTEAMGTSEIEEGMKDEGRMGSVKRGGKKVQLRGRWGDIYIYIYIYKYQLIGSPESGRAGKRVTMNQGTQTDGLMLMWRLLGIMYIFICIFISMYVYKYE